MTNTPASPVHDIGRYQPVPSREDLVQRARELRPLLRECAAATEHARQLLPEVDAQFLAAGFFRIMQPATYGGFELGIETLLDVVVEIGRGCGSSAWVLSLLAIHNWVVGMFPKAAQDEIFGNHGSARLPLVLAPQGTAEVAPGGYCVSGQWTYASGIDVANWVGIAVLDPAQPVGAPPRLLTCIVRREEVTIHDDWFVLGLRGTGSKAAVLRNVFVPAHRAMSLLEAETQGPPGALVNTGPLYRGVPRVPIFCMCATAPAIGIARSMLDFYQERIETHKNAYMAAKHTDSAASQQRLARATALIDSAELLLRSDAGAVAAMIEGGGKQSLVERGRMRMHMAEALRLCTEAVDLLFVDAGTGAMFVQSPLQRAFRDIHAIHTHVALNYDSAAENFGRVLLGLKPNSPLI